MKQLLAAAVLAVSFVFEVVLSGLATLRVILHPGRIGHAGLVTFEFAPMSEAGAALLGVLVTLTPGTTVVDIDMARRRMLLHLLDSRDAAGAERSIRRQFERHVVVLFGRGET